MLNKKDLKPGIYFALNPNKIHKSHHYQHINLITEIDGDNIIAKYICSRNDNIYSIMFQEHYLSLHKDDDMLHKLPEKEVNDLLKWLIFK